MHTLFYFAIVLGVLITVHEVGHFIAAKLFDVKVEVFSVGFGPKVLRRRFGETEYALSLFPLGGYVKMSGEDPDVPVKDPRDFYAKPPWQRILIAAAGPLMNLLLAFLLFAASFSMGRYIPSYQLERAKVGEVIGHLPLKRGDIILSVNGRKVKSWKEFSRLIALNPGREVEVEVLRKGRRVRVSLKVGRDSRTGIGKVDVVPAIKPLVGRVVKGSPAEVSGLKEGDVILSIDGKEIGNWEEVVETVRDSKGKELSFKVLRGGKELTIKVKPRFNRRYGRYMVGIVPKLDMTFVKFSPVGSLKAGFKEVLSQSSLFFSFLYKLITLKASIKSLGGPIMIAQVAGKAASAGLSNFIYFMGFISLQLGYFNLIPLPVLDGGLILLFIVEVVRRKPISSSFREKFQQAGMAILGLLMILVFYNDILRLIN